MAPQVKRTEISAMVINKINIENYRCFHGKFSLELNPDINILVGNNEAGKSTILEAINLALTGLLNGRYLRNELSQYLFNHQTVTEYIKSLAPESDKALEPPSICIEVFFLDDECPRFEGDGNSDRAKGCGVILKIEFDPEYQGHYEALLSEGGLNSIPVEYYRIVWKSFAREVVTARSIPLKCVLIDSSSTRYQNGSDVYISRIIDSDLDDAERAAISQEYRKMKELFGSASSVKAINKKIKDKAGLTDKELSISVDLATHNSWQTTLMTYLDEVPFHFIGKGEQCVLKTNLALGNKKSEKANLILLEEPENHLTHTKLNNLLRDVVDNCAGKQIIITTHNSFVANKLGLENLILLKNPKYTKLTDLPPLTYRFFQKLAGYQTLRLLLCRKAVLVEGPSDELVFQKAYMKGNGGRLPIEDSIDVISVGLSFKRFLEVAEMLSQPTCVITDNDHDFENKVKRKYQDFDEVECIQIFADDRNELNTLEPQIVDANKDRLSELRSLLDISGTYNTQCKVSCHMQKHKTACALKIFESDNGVEFPAYILNAVRWCDE